MSGVEAISFDEVECGKKVAEYLTVYSGPKNVTSGDSTSMENLIIWNSRSPLSLESALSL
jgi:hypothetical protein